MQPPARRPDVSLYRLGTEPVFFDRAQSMDPHARKTECRLDAILTPNSSCECQERSRLPTPPSSRRQPADPCNKVDPSFVSVHILQQTTKSMSPARFPLSLSLPDKRHNVPPYLYSNTDGADLFPIRPADIPSGLFSQKSAKSKDRFR